jgi:outer membrane protein OmpA-like peptidoglycan-associated protein
MNALNRKFTVALAALTVSTGMTGCASMNNTEKGAAAGGGAGAAIGAIIGRQNLPAAEVERVGEGIAVTFESGVLFPYNSADVLPAGRENLRQLATSLRNYPGTTVLIVGHTDSSGSDEYNMGLSYRRAESARSFLAAQGIDASRVRVEGRGESEPVADNSTEAGRQQNRRVEIAIFASEEYREQILRENRQ